DENLTHYAKLINKFLNKDVAKAEGAGAAGGLGAALLAFLNGNLKRGIDLVVKHTKLNEKIEGADYIFTGEGSVDGQTIFGKTPTGVAKVAKHKGIPVIAFAGRVGEGSENLYSQGINSIVCILSGVTSLEQALQYGKENTERCVENIVRIININKK
ncbi:MAG: glycerate kinase, partial [Sarcina sp.]